MPRRLKIFYHDNCFDGATSAAIFADFYRAHVDGGADILLQGVQHMRGDPFAPYTLDGDDNACVDFRFCGSPKMTWWFDHHISAFQPPELKEQFERDESGQKFYDPTARSCANFASRTLASEFGYRPEDPNGHWAELLHWADIIDGAQFESPTQAVELKEPALRLMTWIEHNHEVADAHRLIELLGRRSLSELAEETWVKGPLTPLLAEHHKNIETVRARATYEGGVVFFDLCDDGIAAHNKFISYMLYPDARYTVGVTSSAERVKVSVGSNPWKPETRRHNIASICERYGGGGHPVVGAVSIGPGEFARAREIAAEVVAELRDVPKD